MICQGDNGIQKKAQHEQPAATSRNPSAILAAAAAVRTPPNQTSASASFPLPNESPHNANKRFWPIVTYWANGVLRVVGWAG